MNTPTPQRDRFALTDAGAARGIVHLRRVIREETERYDRVREKVATLHADNEARARHIDACAQHLDELESYVDGLRADYGDNGSDD